MKANELRIGNYVNYMVGRGTYKQGVVRTINNGSCNVTGIGDSSPIYPAKFKVIDGIPLTEEWLFKFGFVTHDQHDYFIDIGSICEIHSWFSVFNGGEFYYIDAFDVKIKYVHQFQNLYFALTGNELTIEK